VNVLFVCSGNKKGNEISPIVSRQALSLTNIGLEVSIFKIEGKGLLSYLKNRNKLKKELTQNNFDLIHAHYSFSGILAGISTRKIPIITSLMGSDVKVSVFWKCIILFSNSFLWKKTIVKAERMLHDIKLKNVHVIPNGVDFEVFKPIDSRIAKSKVNFTDRKKYVIFVSDPERKEKNFELALKAIDRLQKKSNVELYVVFNENGLSAEAICDFMNAADALLMTSMYEGSPNVIKEAMACNCPIVSTDVGDVNNVIGTTNGCFITDNNPENIARKLEKAINFGKTNGRKNIDYLNSKKIALEISNLYQHVLQK
jgi:glycosyltransferase involved in cell wall biosynthesis